MCVCPNCDCVCVRNPHVCVYVCVCMCKTGLCMCVRVCGRCVVITLDFVLITVENLENAKVVKKDTDTQLRRNVVCKVFSLTEREPHSERAGKWAHSQHASISLLRSLCLGRSFCCRFSSSCQCISLSIGSRPLQKQPTSWSVPDCIKWVTSRCGGFFCFPLIVLFIKFYHELVEWPAFNTEGTYQWERICVYLGLPGFLGLTIFTRKAAHFPILLCDICLYAQKEMRLICGRTFAQSG